MPRQFGSKFHVSDPGERAQKNNFIRRKEKRAEGHYANITSLEKLQVNPIRMTLFKNSFVQSRTGPILDWESYTFLWGLTLLSITWRVYNSRGVAQSPSSLIFIHIRTRTSCLMGNEPPPVLHFWYSKEETHWKALFFKDFIFLSNLYTHHGAGTHNPEIMVSWLSQQLPQKNIMEAIISKCRGETS